MLNISDNKYKNIHDFCDSRWQFYINRDGAYFPSKHDQVVLQEAANEFHITPEEAEQAFQRVAKVKADAEIKGMSKSQMVEMFKDIVEGNAETPWGQEKLKQSEGK